jgi:type IV pilus assembly protein PilB
MGEFLVEWGIIQPKEVQLGLDHAKKKNLRIGEALIDLKLCTEANIYKALAAQNNMEYVDLDRSSVSPQAMNLIPDDLMRKYIILPLGMEGGKLKMAIHDPFDLEMQQIVGFRVSKPLMPVLAPKGRIKGIIDELFNTTAANTIDKTMDKTIDRLKSSMDKSVDKSLDKSIDQGGKSIDVTGVGEGRRDAGADHQTGARADRRGGAKPSERHSHRTDEGPGAGALSHRRRVCGAG